MNKDKLINQLNCLPFVSVIMPVFNAELYLDEAIESILSQTYQNFELLIVNDSSTDKSLTIIKKYQRLYPKRIKVISTKKNLNGGGDKCANLALKYAKGAYVARMDADDIAHKNRLTVQVSFLEQNPDVFLVGSNAYVINKNGKIIGEKKEPLSSKAIYNAYATFHPIIHPTCMFRRVSEGKKFFYDIKYSANNDYYTFFKMLCLGAQFVNLKEKLIYYRIHGKNDTFVDMKEKFINTLKIRLVMAIEYGYPTTYKKVVISLIQAAVLFFLPSLITRKLYLFFKGIITFDHFFKQRFSTQTLTVK